MGSIEQFLEQVARRGSWFGGGSVAAFSAALSAALLEKLVFHAPTARRIQRIRRSCIELVQRDAVTFSRVIQAIRAGEHQAFRRTLKSATEVPCQVFEHAQVIRAVCRAAQRSVEPRFRSDLRCAMAVALAAGESARALIDTNLAWLNDARYAQAVHRRLRSAGHTRTR
ncbi:MAG: cyclodeaminase/cyclohydrolase family protein [Candidatus Omnitrophica bacterium]|nr:cyclodeaminase/cyclohydrolase family protein [Candidatus Omnitrophota bacterium]MBI2495982.1 cyclodeaminase/cyclohydrolase family protein [Candidatus Omnitrophota bacterium]MBI3020753.1 cyclodeaminase/cyclohydrolase family protein [Candidatus Omnitrophota bacterium]MBI3083070.1 cyclodeaminase/cyclohydrolase family protein [Candidatus Omnitrophota bacterium]